MRKLILREMGERFIGLLILLLFLAVLNIFFPPKWSNFLIVLLVYPAVIVVGIIRQFFSSQDEMLAVVISDQVISGMPEAPVFNGFRPLERIDIPFDRIDRQRTEVIRPGRWNGNWVSSIDGKNLYLSPALDRTQLREIAGLIGCPFEEGE
jgi:hypothetical protein